MHCVRLCAAYESGAGAWIQLSKHAAELSEVNRPAVVEIKGVEDAQGGLNPLILSLILRRDARILGPHATLGGRRRHQGSDGCVLLLVDADIAFTDPIVCKDDGQDRATHAEGREAVGIGARALPGAFRVRGRGREG